MISSKTDDIARRHPESGTCVGRIALRIDSSTAEEKAYSNGNGRKVSGENQFKCLWYHVSLCYEPRISRSNMFVKMRNDVVAD